MKYQAKPGFMKRKIAGENILVPVGTTTQEFNGTAMLNETGSFLWDELKSARLMEELVAAVAAEFDAPSDMIQEDVNEFVTNGVREGLIQEIPE